MIAEIEPVEQLVLQIRQLSSLQRYQLIQRITETLMPAIDEATTPLQFGKYRSDHMSGLEDFTIFELSS